MLQNILENNITFIAEGTQVARGAGTSIWFGYTQHQAETVIHSYRVESKCYLTALQVTSCSKEAFCTSCENTGSSHTKPSDTSNNVPDFEKQINNMDHGFTSYPLYKVKFYKGNTTI